MNVLECPPGFSNQDELAIRLGSVCLIEDKYYVAVQLFNIACLSALEVCVLVKAYPLLTSRERNMRYIPHFVLACWGAFGLVTTLLFLYKASASVRVSDVQTLELLLHGMAPIPLFPAVWLFIFSLMVGSCSSEIGSRGRELRKKFWQVARFFMVTEMVLYPLPFWLTIAFPSWIYATSTCMIVNMMIIASTVGIFSAVYTRNLDAVFGAVIRREKENQAARSRLLRRRDALIPQAFHPLDPARSSPRASFSSISLTMAPAPESTRRKSRSSRGSGGGGEGGHGTTADVRGREEWVVARTLTLALNGPGSEALRKTECFNSAGSAVRGLEVTRARLRVGGCLICFAGCGPAFVLSLLALTTDWLGSRTFFSYSACYGLLGLVGMGAVLAMKATPPNKHTHQCLFLEGGRNINLSVTGMSLKSRNGSQNWSWRRHRNRSRSRGAGFSGIGKLFGGVLASRKKGGEKQQPRGEEERAGGGVMMEQQQQREGSLAPQDHPPPPPPPLLPPPPPPTPPTSAAAAAVGLADGEGGGAEAGAGCIGINRGGDGDCKIPKKTKKKVSPHHPSPFQQGNGGGGGGGGGGGFLACLRSCFSRLRMRGWRRGWGAVSPTNTTSMSSTSDRPVWTVPLRQYDVEEGHGGEGGGAGGQPQQYYDGREGEEEAAEDEGVVRLSGMMVL